MTILGFHT